MRFAAYPSIADDTLAYVPHPISTFSLGSLGTIPATRERALGANRSRLHQVLTLWTTTAPQSAVAHEMLAELLELLGSIRERDDQRSALSEVRHARRLVSDSLGRLRLAQTELRLLAKSEDFAGAKALADSLLAVRRPGGAEAQRLVGAAALTGRLRRTEELLTSITTGGLEAPELPDGRPLHDRKSTRLNSSHANISYAVF